MDNANVYLKQAEGICKEVKKVIFGKDEVIRKVLMAIMAGGHILIDDIPGVGKTTLSAAFARSMGLEEKRMQFTPDVLPSDITGFSIYNKTTGEFEYRAGVVMCNLFLGDEINRTSPKTQAALLEVMEEGRVTVDGVTREVPKPFTVIATQNPSGSIGTQKLPESQLDRFMIRTSIGYPKPEDEVRIIQGKKHNLIDTVKEVITKEEVVEFQTAVKNVHMDDSICMYIARLVEQSRQDEELQLGVSPRGTVAISAMAKAAALLAGRDYVVPDDVQSVLHETMEHRIILTAKARVNKTTENEVIKRIISRVKVPAIR